MQMKGITSVLRPKRRAATLALALGCGVLAATAVPSVGAGSSSFPDMRGSYHQGACVGGTLAQCEANPQYPSTLTISTEDFTTGAIGLSDGETGTISACTMTIGPAITNSMPANPYQSQEHYVISSDANHLTGTFDDTYGRRGQPIFANRDTPGPDSCPPGGTTTTGTTTTTTTGPTLTPTATQVMCNYFVTTNDDVCTATVGDATGAGTTPTGNVAFSGDRTGQCSLAATPLSPGVASCSITVIGTQNFLHVTATYPGDATQAGSTGTTQFLSAAPGNGLYNPTIQPFSPNTISLLDNNPVPGATVNGQLELTDAGTTECSTTSTPSAAHDYAAAARRTGGAATLTASTTIRNARRGKLRLHLTLNQVKARALFKPNQTLLLIVKVTVKARHGKALVGTTLARVRLKFTKHGVLLVKAPAAKASSRAHDAEAPKCFPGATITLARSRNETSSGWYGTLNMTVVIPPGVPNTPERDAATSATLTGSIQVICRKIPTPTVKGTLNVNETFSGGLSSTGSSPHGLTYKLSRTGSLFSVTLGGQLPGPPATDPTVQCPTVDLSGNLEQVGDITTIPVPPASQ